MSCVEVECLGSFNSNLCQSLNHFACFSTGEILNCSATKSERHKVHGGRGDRRGVHQQGIRSRGDDGKFVSVTVKATDQGDPSLEGVCSFTVEITDVNDNPPLFDRQVSHKKTISPKMYYTFTDFLEIRGECKAGCQHWHKHPSCLCLR